jgi:hypothetical protein
MDSPPLINEFKAVFNKAFPPLMPVYDDEETDSRISRTDVANYTVRDSLFGTFTYSCMSTHVGNSTIVYLPPSNGSVSTVAGQIQRIDLLDGRPRFTVKRYGPIAHEEFDPFARYPHFHCRSFASTFLSQEDVISLHDIISHGASLKLDNGRIAILNLSRL